MKLDQIIPDESNRRVVYVVFGALGLALGVTQTAFASVEAAQPAWLTAAFAVYAYLAAAGFAVSQANTSSGTVQEAPVIGLQDQSGAQDPDKVLLANPEPGEFEEGQVTPTAAVDPADLAKHAE